MAHSYEPRIMAAALSSRSKLKASTSLIEDLAAAAPLILVTQASAALVRDLPGVVLPSWARMREASVRLELPATL